jgi:branched-chain amino acid transport system ATP-binding protein
MANNIQLELKNVTTVYGRNKMLLDVSLQIPRGKIVGLLGSNGAGKSTLIKAILGLVNIIEGSITFEGQDITGQKTYQTMRQGMSIVPEGKRIFPKMSVLENLRMGGFKEKDKEVIEERLETVYHHFPRLKERLTQVAGTLSGGEQSMLTIGRGLMGDPRLIIFDEPSFGLAPVLVQETFEIVKKINSMGITVFLVEQNAHMTLDTCDSGYFLQKGQIIASGSSEELKGVDIIKKAYFGG